ncbi:nuclear transport factor 2 family protein [Sanguibacter sp. 25GB23B1]|uniref:nuclear transport factor 2 family protein n=1 Tax=unclassified Sanguibacter TaxID=2645534 RepID=UPI0032B00C6A
MTGPDLTASDRYFHLKEAEEATAALAVFAADATVVDDGRTYLGHDEIREWLTGAASEFTTTSTRLSVEQDGDALDVLVRVEGNFPGGRVDLHHRFTTDAAGRVANLTIAP